MPCLPESLIAQVFDPCRPSLKGDSMKTKPDVRAEKATPTEPRPRKRQRASYKDALGLNDEPLESSEVGAWMHTLHKQGKQGTKHMVKGAKAEK